jgi:hypothetical protein
MFRFLSAIFAFTKLKFRNNILSQVPVKTMATLYVEMWNVYKLGAPNSIEKIHFVRCLGRILNRLSCDMFVIDQKLPSCLQRLGKIKITLFSYKINSIKFNGKYCDLNDCLLTTKFWRSY